MTTYIKKTELEGEGLKFRLKNLESIEQFSIWDNELKKFARAGDNITTKSGNMIVDKYMKLTDEDKKRYTRKLTFVRNIIPLDKVKFPEDDYALNFPSSMDVSMNDKLVTLEVGNVDPLVISFKLAKKGKMLDTVYSLTIEKDVVEQSTAPPQPVSTTPPETTTQPEPQQKPLLIKNFSVSTILPFSK